MKQFFDLTKFSLIRQSQKLDDICFLSITQKADIVVPPKVAILHLKSRPELSPSESFYSRPSQICNNFTQADSVHSTSIVHLLGRVSRQTRITIVSTFLFQYRVDIQMLTLIATALEKPLRQKAVQVRVSRVPDRRGTPIGHQSITGTM
jgi:hypothetical protein